MRSEVVTAQNLLHYKDINQEEVEALFSRLKDSPNPTNELQTLLESNSRGVTDETLYGVWLKMDGIDLEIEAETNIAPAEWFDDFQKVKNMIVSLNGRSVLLASIKQKEQDNFADTYLTGGWSWTLS